MDYNHFSTEDFVLDEYFQRWVYSPDDETNPYWEQFLTAYPEQRKAVEEARRFLESTASRESMLGEEVPEAVIQDIKARFNHEINERELHISPARHVAFARAKQKKSHKRFYLAAAAVLVGAALLGPVFFKSDAPASFLRRLSLEQQETFNGGLRHIVLNDGTQVWLNASSRLQFPKDFRHKELREVYLEGEAFFDVYEDSKKPFVVRASGVSIQVLGTTFNVKSYAADQFVETTLVSGKVTIANDQNEFSPVILRPNQQAFFSKQSREIELKEVLDTKSHVEWRNGWMIFEDQPFDQIRQTLERWYNVTIHVEDSRSLSCTFSAKFKDKPLEEILEIFSHTAPIRYQIDGSRVFIHGQLCTY